MRLNEFLKMEAASGGEGGGGSAGGAGGGAGAGSGAAGAGGGAAGAGGAGSAGSGGAAGAGSSDWVAGITDEPTRQWVTAKGFKDPAALAQSALNLEKLTGDLNSVVKIPKEMTPENMNPIYDRLGRPKTPMEYGLKPLEGTDGKFIETAGKWFHEAGLNGQQARAVSEKWNAHVKETLTAQQQEIADRDAAQTAQLKKDWGADFDQHVGIVDAAIEKFGMKDDQLLALKQAMGPAEAMKFLHNIGKGMGVEGDLVGAGKGGGFNGTTAQQAHAQIGELRKDPSFTARFLAGDVEARREMERLHKIAYAGEQTL